MHIVRHTFQSSLVSLTIKVNNVHAHEIREPIEAYMKRYPHLREIVFAAKYKANTCFFEDGEFKVRVTTGGTTLFCISTYDVLMLPRSIQMVPSSEFLG